MHSQHLKHRRMVRLDGFILQMRQSLHVYFRDIIYSEFMLENCTIVIAAIIIMARFDFDNYSCANGYFSDKRGRQVREKWKDERIE